MKKLHLAVCLVASVSLAGCAGLNSARDWLASPQTAQAVANAKGWAQVFACAVSDASALAGQIEQAVAADQAAKDTTTNVYTVSAIVCTRLGGVPSTKPVAGVQ